MHTEANRKEQVCNFNSVLNVSCVWRALHIDRHEKTRFACKNKREHSKSKTVKCKTCAKHEEITMRNILEQNKTKRAQEVQKMSLLRNRVYEWFTCCNNKKRKSEKRISRKTTISKTPNCQNDQISPNRTARLDSHDRISDSQDQPARSNLTKIMKILGIWWFLMFWRFWRSSFGVLLEQSEPVRRRSSYFLLDWEACLSKAEKQLKNSCQNWTSDLSKS